MYTKDEEMDKLDKLIELITMTRKPNKKNIKDLLVMMKELIETLPHNVRTEIGFFVAGTNKNGEFKSKLEIRDYSFWKQEINKTNPVKVLPIATIKENIALKLEIILMEEARTISDQKIIKQIMTFLDEE